MGALCLSSLAVLPSTFV